MSFSLTKRAGADLDEIAEDIGEEQGIDASRHWLDAITLRFDALGSRPRMGRTRDHDLGPGRRSVLFGSYIVVYRLAGSDAVILRVVHGRRDLSRLSFDG